MLTRLILAKRSALTLPAHLKYSSTHLNICQTHIAPHARREAYGKFPQNRSWRKTRTRTAGGQHMN